MLTAVLLDAPPSELDERRDHLDALFREAQPQAIQAMDALLLVLRCRGCDPALVAAATETARSALDQLWTASSRVDALG